MLAITLLPEDDDTVPFPPLEHALREPNGLLAIGGNLRPRRLLQAYRRGIFPWFSRDEPILWWSPDPRCVLFPGDFHASRSLRRSWRRARFRLTRDRAFAQVVQACAEPRPNSPGTWIVPSMAHAYRELYRLGFATSVECWEADELVGGIYGVKLGRVFFGESMFSRRSDASKLALWHVTTLDDVELVDCQLENPHLRRLGASMISRRRFLQLLEQLDVR